MSRRTIPRRSNSAGPTRRWFNITKNDETSSAEVFIYDEIDWLWGVTARDFADEVNALDVDSLTVRINSPGGDVHEALAILNTLRAHKARVTTVVEGVAASSASFIAMAGDEVVIRPNAELMIHDPWAIAMGSADDMRSTAKDLDRITLNIASIYADKVGNTAADWIPAMSAETWYSADEAVAAGLVDRIDTTGLHNPPAESGTEARNAFDLSAFRYRGRRDAPAPVARAAGTQRKETPMATLSEQVAERLGIDTDADEATVIAALDEALAEQTEASAPAGDGETPALGDVEAVQKFAARHGLSLVDTQTVESMRNAEARLRQIEGERADERHAQVVDAAVRDGKIAPARRDHWLGALRADPDGATAVLDGLASNLIPVAPVGYGADFNEGQAPQPTEDPIYSGWEVN